MELIVKDCAALIAENQVYVTGWQDIVKGGVELAGFNGNVTQVCMLNKLVIPALHNLN